MKSILLTLCICFFTYFPLLAQTPKDSLKAHYRFSGNTDDVSGNNKHAVVNGTGVSLTTDRFNMANSAYSFNGTDGDITANVGQIESEISIAFWYMSGGQTKDYPHFVDYGDYRIRCHIMSSSIYNQTDRNGVYYEIYNPSAVEIRGAQKPGDNAWTHITITFSKTSNSMKLYVNGVLDKQKFVSSNDLVLNDGVLVLGRVRTGSPSNINMTRFVGKIDDVMVYSKELSQQEITAIFNGQNVQSIDETENTPVVSIYPNPCSESVTLNLSNENSSYKITDVTGKLISEGFSSETINTSSLPQGLYFVSVFDNGVLTTQEKIIKQ